MSLSLQDGTYIWESPFDFDASVVASEVTLEGTGRVEWRTRDASVPYLLSVRAGVTVTASRIIFAGQLVVDGGRLHLSQCNATGAGRPPPPRSRRLQPAVQRPPGGGDTANPPLQLLNLQSGHLTADDFDFAGMRDSVLNVTGGQAVIHRTFFRQNAAHRGGAICVWAGMVKLVGCTLAENTASEKGGAIYVYTGAVVLLADGTLLENNGHNN